jgi:hypothetical protein
LRFAFFDPATNENMLSHPDEIQYMQIYAEKKEILDYKKSWTQEMKCGIMGLLKHRGQRGMNSNA